MSIQTNAGGFTEATMDAPNGAELHAVLSGDEDDFRVSLTRHGSDSWYFDITACEEAIHFFTLLKEELERRDRLERDRYL